MTGLKKYLLFILITCTLGYSSAWAYDGHAIDVSDSDLVVKDNDSYFSNTSDRHSPEQQSAVDDICDQCCHISAHLVAIFSKNNCSFSADKTSKRLDFSESFISFITSPDLKPPRV
jgi:hypothetical protein